MWPNHGGEQRDMEEDDLQGIREKGNIFTSMERFAMAKSYELEKGDNQVGNQEVHIKDIKQKINYLYKRLVETKEVRKGEIETCYEEGRHCNKSKGTSSKAKAIATMGKAVAITNNQKRKTTLLNLKASLEDVIG